MYFAWSERYEVFWISDPDSVHSLNLMRNRSAAITVYASNQVWGKPDRGIQLFGAAGVTRGREARDAYAKQFRDFDAEANELPFYRFKARAVKLFDERSLAAGTLVTARVTRDGLEWLKTEVWA